MRSILGGMILMAGGIIATPALAHGLTIDTDHCGFRSDYDLSVANDGLHFSREQGQPRVVWMHDGRLSVDGRPLAVNAADADRLRQYETQVRSLLPQVAQVAREGVDIGFSALTTVVATFADGNEERRRLLDKLKRERTDAMRTVDAGVGAGHWSHDQLDDLLESSIGGAVSDLVGTVSASAIKAALSGDETKVAALEARADSLDKSIDREVDKRADRLSERAEALCPGVRQLDDLQQSFTLRLSDGSRLRLLSAAADKRVASDK